MTKQLLPIGQQFNVKGKIFEVVHASCQEDNGKLSDFKYEIQLASEVKARALDEQKAMAEAENSPSDEAEV